MSELEKMRKQILKNLITEDLSYSNIKIRSRKEKGREKKEIIDEYILERYRKYNIGKKLIEIVKAIIDHHPYGIAHNDLANKLKIDRSNLAKYIDQLIEKKIIIRNNKVKDGPYIISPVFFNDNKYSFSIQDFRDNLQGQGMLGIREDLSLEKLIEVKQSIEKREENKLFEFSNKIGAIFTYLCLFAMDPNNEISKFAKNDKEKDLLIMLWIYDMVSNLCLDWLEEFSKMIPYSIKSIFNNNKVKDKITVQEYEEHVHKIMKRQGEKEIKYGYVSEVIEDLQNTLKNLYPEMYSECDYAKNCVYERKLKDVPSGVEKNDMLDYDEYRRNTSKLCDHIKPKDIGKYVSYDLKIKIENKPFKHCQKCHSIYRESDILRYNRKQEWKKFNALTIKLCKHSQMVEISTHSDNRRVIKHCKQCHKTFSEIKKVN